MSTEANSRMRAECREWLTLMHSGDTTEGERARFDAWLHADPRHERAYAKLQDLWNDVGELRHLADLEPVPPLPAHAPRARWRQAPWLAAAASIACLALFATWLRNAELPAPESLASASFAQSFSTALGEVREIALPDGSTVTLGARSKVAVNLGAERRYVQLEQGEAFFSVAKDATRPFHVDAGNAAVRVLGTRFEIHRGPERVRVAVAEGLVSVAGAQAPLTQGQRVDVLASGSLSPIDTITGNSVGAWRDGRLIYEGVSLEEIVADISRYRDDVLLRSERAGALRITAGFRIDQIDAFLNGLPGIVPVQVVRDGSTIAIEARE